MVSVKPKTGFITGFVGQCVGEENVDGENQLEIKISGLELI